MDPELENESHEDDEFGMAESVPVDLNAQIDHAIRSLTAALGHAHWKIGQHAAEVDALKQWGMELQAAKQAQDEVIEQLATRNRELELRLLEATDKLEHSTITFAPGLTRLTPVDDPQPEEAFLAAAAGQPGLGGAGQSAEATDSTAK